MKEFLKRNKDRFLKILIMLAVIAAVTVAMMFVLHLFDIIYFEDGIKLNVELFNSFKSTWYGCVVIILIQVAITSVLSFVPGVSMAFIVLMQMLFEDPWQAFSIAFTGVMLSSLMMYVIGRFGGYAVCKKLLGEKDCEAASRLLNHKGVVFFPLMMMFPIFPDDALIMLAGTLKMALGWFIPSIVIGRGIGVVTIIFGLNIIPFDKFTSAWHWVLFVLACIVGLALVFFAASKFSKYMEKKTATKENFT